MSAVSPLTIEDFERLPDELAHNHELVDGELVDVSGNTGNHNALRDLLIALLLFYVDEHKLGRLLSEQEYSFDSNAHGPDVRLFVPETVALYDRSKRVRRFVPDLAIGSASHNDPFARLDNKVGRSEKSGTWEASILEIDLRTAVVYSDACNAILGENDLFQSSLIPGFSIRIGDLFDRL